MQEHGDKQLEYWAEQLRHPDWYIRLEDYLISTIFPLIHDNPNLKTKRHRFYELVEKMMISNEIPLAKDGPNLDSDRKEIDIIVIHHTAEESDIRLSKLSAIGFVRQYGMAYLEDDVWGHKGLRGQPIWSGHFRNGKMVFFAYHWLVRPNGKTERLLEDVYVGRQSHDLNPRSIGIALSGNYEHSIPPIAQIEASAKIIKDNYPDVGVSSIFGHLEVMLGRTCPGDKFLEGWKGSLLAAVKQQII